jgi:hypothetical protein
LLASETLLSRTPRFTLGTALAYIARDATLTSHSFLAFNAHVTLLSWHTIRSRQAVDPCRALLSRRAFLTL